MSTASDEPLAPGVRIDWNVGHHGVVGLIVTGEIDMAVTDQFRCALMTALHLPGLIEVVVDLGALRFLDCSGVAALVQAKHEADRRCARFRVVNVRGLPRRVLKTLNEYDTLADGAPGPGVIGAGYGRAVNSSGAGDPVSPTCGAECAS
jgi:anti-anti-sigma factor